MNGWKIQFSLRRLSQIVPLCRQRMPRPQISQRKFLQIAGKPRNLQKFSASKVSCYQTSSDNVTKVKVVNFFSFQFNVMVYNPIGRPAPLYFQFPVNSESLTVTDDKLKVLDIPCEVSLRSNKMQTSLFSLVSGSHGPSGE